MNDFGKHLLVELVEIPSELRSLFASDRLILNVNNFALKQCEILMTYEKKLNYIN